VTVSESQLHSDVYAETGAEDEEAADVTDEIPGIADESADDEVTDAAVADDADEDDAAEADDEATAEDGEDAEPAEEPDPIAEFNRELRMLPGDWSWCTPTPATRTG